MFRQTWDKYWTDWYSDVLRENPDFLSPPSSSSLIPDYDAPVNVADYYGQRLVAYFQVCCHISKD